MKAYKATVKPNKNGYRKVDWTFFSNNLEWAIDYAERMAEETYYGEGQVISVEETEDPRNE